jgi:exodeoxyribonuclease-3
VRNGRAGFLRQSARIVSWNVNGLRAAQKRGFSAWLSRSGAAVVGIQEVRALEEDLPPALAPDRLEGRWSAHYSPATRKGYSGVALYSRREPDELETSLGIPRYDAEGRLQIARFGKLVVVNGYFPNGNGKDRDNSRVRFKLGFYRAVNDALARHRRAGRRVLVMGDFNTAHTEIDLARPKGNAKTSGFLPIERKELDRWVATGWVDTFRHFEKRGGHYSWWSQRQGARERNVGWRIDYVMASPEALPFVEKAFIQSRTKGSDHCPIGVDLDPAVFGDV